MWVVDSFMILKMAILTVHKILILINWILNCIWILYLQIEVFLVRWSGISLWFVIVMKVKACNGRVMGVEGVLMGIRMTPGYSPHFLLHMRPNSPHKITTQESHTRVPLILHSPSRVKNPGWKGEKAKAKGTLWKVQSNKVGARHFIRVLSLRESKVQSHGRRVR